MAREKVVHTVVGIELVRKLSEEGRRIFTADEAREIAPIVGIRESYFRQVLHHLARTGWIVRLHKGLYALAGSVPGMTPVHEYEIAMKLVVPAAIGFWSAMSYHGLTEQAPRHVFVLTSSRSIPRRRRSAIERSEGGYKVGETIYRFVQVKRDRFFGFKDEWVKEAKIQMTDPERTLLDGLMFPQYCGGFAEVLHAFEVRRPKLDLDQIIAYALNMDAATKKRVGWILERHLEYSGEDAARLKQLRDVQISGYRPLDPTGPRRGPCDSGWMIQVNLPGKVRV